MNSRRDFLMQAAACGGCLGLGTLAPAWWQRAAAAAEASRAGRTLVVIELEGGNDGLNTVVPFADDAYYQARPTLAVAAKDVIKLDDHLGLHPAMKSWKSLWGAGQLAVIENCGYPNPNRSHFESMDIWHGGAVGAATPSGWLGRAADESSAGELCFVGDGAVPHALSRRLKAVCSLERLSDLQFRASAEPVPSAAAPPDDLAAIIAGRLQAAQSLSAQLAKIEMPAPPPLNATTIAAGSRPLADRLSVIRTLIEQDQQFGVYYTSLGGFDTHSQQKGTHESLWKQTSEAVSGFLTALDNAKRSEGVTVFLFSEFGRRVKENGSQGTDHGAAAPVFVLGKNVWGGIQGGVPNLADLDDGDLKHQIDFRDVYASLLKGGLGIDPTPVFGAREAELKLFN